MNAFISIRCQSSCAFEGNGPTGAGGSTRGDEHELKRISRARNHSGLLLFLFGRWEENIIEDKPVAWGVRIQV